MSDGTWWQLGPHRLVCGDSGDPAVIRVALGDDVADTVIYDPVYDIPASEWSPLHPAPSAMVFCDYARIVQAVEMVRGYPVVWEMIWDLCASIYRPGRPLLRHRTCLVAMQAESNWRFDAALYKDGKLRPASRVLPFDHDSDAPRPAESEWVHLQTLIRLPKRHVEGASRHAKPTTWLAAMMGGLGSRIILDQHAGSGASIMAARPGMSVRAIEIDQEKCEAIIERWEASS